MGCQSSIGMVLSLGKERFVEVFACWYEVRVMGKWVRSSNCGEGRREGRRQGGMCLSLSEGRESGEATREKEGEQCVRA